MGGATLKNAVKRKTHKERAQPAARRKLGLLEKKSDYKARAADFQRKRATLASLRRKVEQRNPDEFYFAMEKQRTKGGVHVTESAVANKYTADELALMRTQDVRYVAARAATEARKAARLASALHGVGAVDRPPSSHVVFVDDDAGVASFDPVAHFDTPADLLGRAHNRPRTRDVDRAAAAVAVHRGGRPDRAAMKADKARAAAYTELERRKARAASLRRVEDALRTRGALQSKGRARRVTAKGGGQGRMYKWAKVRKR